MTSRMPGICERVSIAIVNRRPVRPRSIEVLLGVAPPGVSVGSFRCVRASNSIDLLMRGAFFYGGQVLAATGIIVTVNIDTIK